MIAITFNGHRAENEDLIGKVIDLKFRGQSILINATSQIDDEYYIPNLNYENNYVETIQIKCDLCEYNARMDKVLNVPRTYYIHQFCTVILIGGKDKSYETIYVDKVDDSIEGIYKKIFVSTN